MDLNKIDSDWLEQFLTEIEEDEQLPEEEKLIKPAENVQRTDPRVMGREPLTPTPYQPEPPPRKDRIKEAVTRVFEPGPQDEWGDKEGEGETKHGRRYIQWTLIRKLEEPQVEHMMKKLYLNVGTSFFIRYNYSQILENIETEEEMIYYTQRPGSPWLRTLEEARDWLTEEEAARLEGGGERPSTKWKSKGFFDLTIKIVQDRNTPLLGAGELPDWLKNLARGRAMVALDNHEDNLCLWRCIAVYQGERPDRCERPATKMAYEFYGSPPYNIIKLVKNNIPKTPLNQLEKVERFLNKGKPVAEWVGIRVYEPEQQEDGKVNWVLVRRAPAKLERVITLGLYNEHTFLIKDIDKLAKIYACKDCEQKFTQSGHLDRHGQTCHKGKTQIWCQTGQVEKPRTAYEQAFYPERKTSKVSILWIEEEGKKIGRHIHHALCGHGGERYLLDLPVDGYEPESKTVYQFHGCIWHGCESCYPKEREKKVQGVTLEERREATRKRTMKLRRAGYKVNEVWSCEVGQYRGKAPQEETRSYPHAIFYDFEAYNLETNNVEANVDKKKKKKMTVINEHVPISVSIGDTLEREPTHICDRDPESLVRRFVQELEKRGKRIREEVCREYMPEDISLIPRKQREKIEGWCNQVPVLGFNAGKYDLNLIKNYFVGELTTSSTPTITVGKKANKTMYMHTKDFRFLDIINYIGPGVDYAKWVEAYTGKKEKTWFPYEWFDSPEKLDHEGLPPYEAWYSELKKSQVLTKEEYAECENRFKEKGMKTMEDWLRDYNNQDVAPGLEALQNMRSFYTEKGIDMLKDAVSLPGVSMHYLLRGAVERGAKLEAPNKEAYEMLKGAVVGGPSLVFTRYHKVGKTRVRAHRVKEPKLCKSILGYDANSLYLSTMLKDMPCGRGKVVHHDADEDNPSPVREETAKGLTKRLREGSWFGFAEVDIEIPEELWPKFEEMCPFFYNKSVPEEAIPEQMVEYLKKTGRKKMEGKKLLGALTGEKLLLYAPLLRWYVEHGAEVTRVYRTIDYNPAKIFTWFVEQVTEARRQGDIDKSKALLADVFKLLGNSAYGKMIEALERQTTVFYTKDEKLVDKTLRSAYFEDLEEIGEAYELERRKAKITLRRPYQIGIAVYQLAKLRMLEFYYDFLDKFIDRSDFELIQMDTDSNYLAITGSSLEEVVRPELREQYEAEKKQWLAWDKWSSRTPGLFKLEMEGTGMIALCSKCYYIEDKAKKKKLSSKGVSQRQNVLNWERYEAALEGEKDMAKNRGFRMRDGKMVTYEQNKLGLSAYYDKRWVLPDGIHTEPIEYHLS